MNNFSSARSLAIFFHNFSHSRATARLQYEQSFVNHAWAIIMFIQLGHYSSRTLSIMNVNFMNNWISHHFLLSGLDWIRRLRWRQHIKKRYAHRLTSIIGAIRVSLLAISNISMASTSAMAHWWRQRNRIRRQPLKLIWIKLEVSSGRCYWFCFFCPFFGI